MKTFNKWQRLVVAALAGSIAVGASVQAFAHGQGRHHGGSQAAMDPAKMDQRIESMVQRMLGRVNATEEQRTKVTAIAKQAAADLRTLRGTRGELRTKAMALLAAPTVDRAAIPARPDTARWCSRPIGPRCWPRASRPSGAPPTTSPNTGA